MLFVQPGRQTARSRLLCYVLVLIGVLSLSSCRSKDLDSERGEGDHDGVNAIQPKDPIFLDFRRNFKQLVSTSHELTLPVSIVGQPKGARWLPIIQQDCVFSAAAGKNVPQVTLTWNEVPQPATLQVAETNLPPTRLRFDLSLHFQGLEQNEYSSALSTDTLKRFVLPSNSTLVSNTDALLVTGPSLFPKLVSFHAQTITPPGSSQSVSRQTLVMSEFAQGLAYRLRRARFGGQQWNEDGQLSFSTPVCPQDF
jgi:hypothetical protein